MLPKSLWSILGLLSQILISYKALLTPNKALTELQGFLGSQCNCATLIAPWGQDSGSYAHFYQRETEAEG